MYCPVDPGDYVNVEMPFTSFTKAKGIAGQVRTIQILNERQVKVFNPDMEFVAEASYDDAGVLENAAGFFVMTKVEDIPL